MKEKNRKHKSEVALLKSVEPKINRALYNMLASWKTEYACLSSCVCLYLCFCIRWKIMNGLIYLGIYIDWSAFQNPHCHTQQTPVMSACVQVITGHLISGDMSIYRSDDWKFGNRWSKGELYIDFWKMLIFKEWKFNKETATKLPQR